MCGIVGAIAQRDVAPILMAGLKRLEYRGYDSAGLAIITPEGTLERLRKSGKVQMLENALVHFPLAGMLGIAHTRWATHGIPSERNAHPHISYNDITVVHNGIIENHNELRRELLLENYTFESDTDTEIIGHLIYHFLKDKNNTLLNAIQKTASKLKGAFALGIIAQQDPDHLYAVRQGSPLVIGVGIGENFIASDPLALQPVTHTFIYLEEGDVAKLTRESIDIYDYQGHLIERKQQAIEMQHDSIDRGSYRHYMCKEIFEQPDAINASLEGRLSQDRILEAIFGVCAADIFKKTKHVHIVACGTSYHAGLVAKYWIEEFVRIPCAVEVASEFRYRSTVVLSDTLFICISQSGETADTLAALRKAKEKKYLATLAICNVPESTMVREADLVFMTRAGTEMGVASTKAFTTQLTALLMLVMALGRQQGLSAAQEKECVFQLMQLPTQVKSVLGLSGTIQQLSEFFSDKVHALFLGRGVMYPIALEGALKLKEISYIHAEAYPAGELKHGPLALVDKNMPVIAIAPNDELLEKLSSNLETVRARGGQLIVFTDHEQLLDQSNVQIIKMPSVSPLLAPIIYTIPLQLLAYSVAVTKGTDIDQPRNLAKSVTVE